MTIFIAKLTEATELVFSKTLEKHFSKKLIVSKTSICLSQGEGNSRTMIEIFLWSAAIVLGLTVLLNVVLSYQENNVKWIKKELESLKDLMTDYEQLVEEEKTVESQARRFWDSEELDLTGIRPQLSEAESEWVKSTEKVAKEADECVTNFSNQSGGVLYYYTALFRLIPIIDVVRQIYVIKREIENQLGKKEKDAKDIYKSMERSRSKYRSLLDQYTIQESRESPSAHQQKQRKRKSSRSIEDLIIRSGDLFSGMEERWSIHMLLPLHAFLKDLSQLQLETETEKSWKREAKELIAEAEERLDNFSWWVSFFGNIWILMNNIPIVTTPFKRGMKRIFTALDDLLDRKSKYHFDFIDRSSEKSIFPSTYQSTDDNAIISAVTSIRSRLSKEEPHSRHIIKMCDELENMLRDAHKKEETIGKVCLEKIKCLAQEIDQSLDKFFSSSISEPKLNQFKQIQMAIERLQHIMKVCNIRRQEPTSGVRLKNDIRKLVSKLTTNSDNCSVLSIVGMLGVGKTNLAKAIYYNKTVVERFPTRVWMTVTQGAALKSQVLLIKEDGSKDQSLYITQVRAHLKGKPGLFVLDNISKKEDWDKLKEVLSGMTSGSRIVLTTCSKDVAMHAVADRSSIRQLRLLTKEESWALFQMVTSKPNLDSKVEKLARKVVERCGGLPLAILSLGCLVSANGVTEKNLLWALRRINQGQNQTPWLRAWEQNSEDLSETLRNCLSCFTLFPIDFEIPARRLVTLWVAEGLVMQNQGYDDQNETPEDVAERDLEKLRDCNMIQVVQIKPNGKIKTCRLPSMLRELIFQDSNRTSHRQYSSTHLQRRFAYHFDDRGLDANIANVFSKQGIPLSVLFFDRREGKKPGEHIGNILSTGITSEQFMEIRVLDLERVFRPHLPETISKLIHLKYLGLRWTYLEALPPFMGKLLNLETLDVKHTCIRILPSSIWRLKKLRNLYLNQSYRSRLEGKLSGNFQGSLQTLWGVFIYGSSPLLHEFYRLKSLRKLKLAFQLTETEQETLAKLIVQLNQLHSLRLKSIDEMGDPQHLRVNNMSKMEKLLSLHLFGRLGDRLQRLPQSLTDLTLSASKLKFDPMPELRNLPKLKSLCFYADSYTGDCMDCTTGGFLQLRVLRLWKLKNLEKWTLEEGAMPSLMELEIRSCRKMEVPSGLKHLKTLQKIKLDDMPKFKEEISKSKRTFWDDVEIVSD